MVEVDPDLLRQDANDHWQKWSKDLADVKLGFDELVYSRPDFSLVSGASEVFSAFESSVAALRKYTEAGEESFEGVARALLDSAMTYMMAEGDARSEIDAVEREMDSL